MKIQSFKALTFPDILLITYHRYNDTRGYFTETFNIKDVARFPELKILSQSNFVQHNESYSFKNTVRGLHFQWNPFMGKLVRTIHGYMIDLILDIRPNSSTFGKAILCDMPSLHSNKTGQWIWIPPGFAHGNYFLEDTTIEYLCTGNYNAKCEMGINPFSSDIDWSLAEKSLYDNFCKIQSKCIISAKDRGGASLLDWQNNENNKTFLL